MIPYYNIEPNHTPLTWAIWGILTSILLLTLISAILFSAFFYIKKGKQFLTVKKITIMSTFLTFFLIQVFLMSPLLDLPIPFSMDSITVVTVGFIFGPLEGILFGWVADSLRVLINGWSYQLLPSLMYPMIGFIASIFGLIYWYKIDFLRIKKVYLVMIFQAMLLILFFTLFIFESLLISNVLEDEGLNLVFVFVTTIISLISMEIICYFIAINFKSEKLLLILLIFAAIYFDRIMELIIRPFTQYFSGYESNYSIALTTRMLSSTYLIPIVTITSFMLISITNYVLELE